MIAINNSTMYTMTCKVSLLDLALLGRHREPFNRVLVEYGPRWNHDLGVCQSGPAFGETNAYQSQYCDNGAVEDEGGL